MKSPVPKRLQVPVDTGLFPFYGDLIPSSNQTVNTGSMLRFLRTQDIRSTSFYVFLFHDYNLVPFSLCSGFPVQSCRLHEIVSMVSLITAAALSSCAEKLQFSLWV